MARVVRKVSNKNIANANKKKKVNKWLIGGIIAGVVVAIAVAVILWVTLGNNGEEEHYDYLNTYQLVEGEEVKFQKANYNALLNMMNEEYVGYVDGIIIVLAYNSETLVPEDEDLKERPYATLLKYMAELQVKVNEAKEAGINIELYVVDITISESDWAIMGDSKFGGSTSVSETNIDSISPLLAVIDNTAEEKLVKKCSKNSISTILNTGIKNTEELIDNLLN